MNAMTDKINATISTRANVYFDGKCVSHSIELADGTKKSVGGRVALDVEVQHRRA